MNSEELSISVIKEILMDGDTFTNLLNKVGRFKNIDINYYLQMINNYMNYLVNNTQNLTMSFFERVNYLNRLFNVKTTYNYNDYLKSEHMVTNKLIKVILINKNVLAKFMDFDNNKTYFNNIPIEQYLLKMDNLITYYERNNIKINEEMLANFEMVMGKYSLKLNRMHILPGQKVKEELNKEFEEAILSGINLKESKFIIALNIYINLCKLVNFDFNYFAYYKKLDEKVIVGQMNRDISTITLENNNVVCSTFAKLYAKVLNDVGIRATVSGDIHKYVFLESLQLMQQMSLMVMII